MFVDKRDGVCRSCEGELEITDSDDISLNVVCVDCGDTYEVETDAFGDGCMKYYFPLQVAKLGEASDGSEPDA